MTWVDVKTKLPPPGWKGRVRAVTIFGDKTSGFAFFNGIEFDCSMMSGTGPEGINPEVEFWLEMEKE